MEIGTDTDHVHFLVQSVRRDPHEWLNLAKDARYAQVIGEHRRWLPKANLPPIPGSAHRLLVNENGIWMWQGKPIRIDEKEP